MILKKVKNLRRTFWQIRSNTIETAILSSLIYNEEYARKVLPHIKREYFSDVGQQIVFKLIRDHFLKYKNSPSKDVLLIDIENSSLNENLYNSAIKVHEELSELAHPKEWLLDNTEKFCQKQALFNAISKSASFLEGNDTSSYGKSLEYIQEALGVSFDDNIGHDYLLQADERMHAYREKINRLPTLS